MGLGLFGGGLAVTRYLQRKGMQVTVTDLRKPQALQESIEELRDIPVTFRLGEHRDEDFTQTDLVIANPAVRSDSPYLAMAREKGIPISYEVDLFLDACRAPVLAVTGTNGKSTTTVLCGAILEESKLYRKVWVGGNIGRSLLEFVDEIGPSDLVVLEISSFQLETLLPHPGFPKVAIVTRITPDHLDRHGDFASYVEAKARILAFQSKLEVAVLHGEDPAAANWKKRAKGHVLLYGGTTGNVRLREGWVTLMEGRLEKKILPLAEVPLPGSFNLENVMAATAAAVSLGASLKAIRKAVASFPGLEHRLEFLGEKNGVRVYNNAVSTTPDSTMNAIQALARPIVLIVGGKGKNLSLEPLAKEIVAGTRRAILYGAEGPALDKAIREAGGPEPKLATTLQQAWSLALAEMQPGDTLLYSPAFSSFDQYRNFRERGEEFRRLTHDWMGPGAQATTRAISPKALSLPL